MRPAQPPRQTGGALRRWALHAMLVTSLGAAVPGVRAHPGHEQGVHVDPLSTILLLVGLCLLGGSFLLLTREESARSRLGMAAALVGAAFLAVGAMGWL